MFFEEDFFEPQRAQRAQRERKKEKSLQLMRGLVTLRGLRELIWAAIYL